MAHPRITTYASYPPPQGSGRIREVDISDVHTINPLTIADNGEKLRLILDLRHKPVPASPKVQM